MTFNPTNTTVISGPATIDTNNFNMFGLACPTESECVTTDADGEEVTFNPANAVSSRARPRSTATKAETPYSASRAHRAASAPLWATTADRLCSTQRTPA